MENGWNSPVYSEFEPPSQRESDLEGCFPDLKNANPEFHGARWSDYTRNAYSEFELPRQQESGMEGCFATLHVTNPKSYEARRSMRNAVSRVAKNEIGRESASSKKEPDQHFWLAAQDEQISGLPYQKRQTKPQYRPTPQNKGRTPPHPPRRLSPIDPRHRGHLPSAEEIDEFFEITSYRRPYWLTNLKPLPPIPRKNMLSEESLSSTPRFTRQQQKRATLRSSKNNGGQENEEMGSSTAVCHDGKKSSRHCSFSSERQGEAKDRRNGPVEEFLLDDFHQQTEKTNSGKTMYVG